MLAFWHGSPSTIRRNSRLLKENDLSRRREQRLILPSCCGDYRPLPDALTKTLAESRFFLKPFMESRYLSMALFDLLVHGGCAVRDGVTTRVALPVHAHAHHDPRPPPEDAESLFRAVVHEKGLLPIPGDSQYLCSWCVRLTAALC